MPRARKTWAEKMQAKPPHHVFLDKDFAGIPKGSKLHISSPVEVAEDKNNCDATCPVSTSIFLRIVAEHSWEEFSRTGSTKDLAPFWRVVESSSPIAKKLNFDPAWIDLQQELEKKNT
ncbi:MAG: hypothetical protein EBT28_03290 [Betaproteobacteria bacterium]|nr:hypothetical protein [Betaproteobacteria bacterium]